MPKRSNRTGRSVARRAAGRVRKVLAPASKVLGADAGFAREAVDMVIHAITCVTDS